MKKSIVRFGSLLLAISLLIGMFPYTAFAAEAPEVRIAASGNSSVQEKIVDETHIPYEIMSNGDSENSTVRIMSEQSEINKMDTSYLSISLDKYGETISASDSSTNQVKVLEYTQWQMSARFVQIYNGEIIDDKDVTEQCSWTSSDSTNEILTVTENGLVTAYGASDKPYTITANYQGKIAVSSENSVEMVDKDFVAKLDIDVKPLHVSEEDEEALRCLAFSYLANYEWSAMSNLEGESVSNWAKGILEQRIGNAPSISMPNNILTESYIITGADGYKAYENTGRVAHFISVAAENYKIIKVIQNSNSKVRAVLFGNGTDKYLAYAFSDIEVDKIYADMFSESEENGTRRYLPLTGYSNSIHSEKFSAGWELYKIVAGNNENIKTVGQNYGGIIAKYVSYVTGCDSVTFDSASPVQYVFLNNFTELCEYYGYYNQVNYNSEENYYRSAMYRMEPTYRLGYSGCVIQYLNYDKKNEMVSVPKKSKLNINKEQKLWNRYVYFGDNQPDIYDDTGAIGLKLNESVLFGGEGVDKLTVKLAQMNIIDPIKDVFEWGKLLSEEASGKIKLKKVMSKLMKIPDNPLDMLLLYNDSFIDTNIVTGGPGDDIINGSCWNNSFCYMPGDGNDNYILYGLQNRFYLIGYGNAKVNIEYEKTEDNKYLIVKVNNSDSFTIDVSNLDYGRIDFYQGAPFDEKTEFIYSIEDFYKNPVDIDYWKYSCPVDVQILDSNGQVALELLDGQESRVETEYGLFEVTLEESEYVKTAILFDNNYHVRACGTGNGEMKVKRVQWSMEEEDGQYCSIEKIPVTKDAVYYASDNLEECILKVDTDADGSIDDVVTYDTEIVFMEDTIQVPYGTHKQLVPEIKTSSIDRECYWISADEDVVIVNDDGMLTAVGGGETIVYAIVNDGSGAYAECRVTVPEESLSAEKFTVSGLEQTYDYTGELIEIQLDVFYGDIQLLQDVHYSIEFSELMEPGKAMVTITGINNYSGSLILNYEILAPKEPDTVEEKVDCIIEECQKEGITGQWDIALWLHDWLVYNANYDYTYTNYHPSGVLLNGTGVCQSYAEAYSLLLDAFSIENMVLSAPEMNHAWNLVKIDGEWCHIDCTWDDPGTGGAENYTYFGMNDALMERDHVWNTETYPASTSNKNYYMIRTNANVVESIQELENFLGKIAENQTEYFECYYIGEDSDFSIFEAFRVWWNTYDWKYGLEDYIVEGTKWMLRATMSYGEPWEPPANVTDIVDCPDFTLRGPDGVYPLRKYSNNGMVLIFGREACGNTMDLLDKLQPDVKRLQNQGIQVFVNLENTDVPEELTSVRQYFPDFTYTYYDMFLFDKLLSQVGISGWITYPVIFIINGNGKIVSCSTGYVQSTGLLLQRIEESATDHPLPSPDPVDGNYYGSMFNYTGNDIVLKQYIDEWLLTQRTQIIVRDGLSADNEESWNGERLGNALGEALEPYYSDIRYDISSDWLYYSDYRCIIIQVDYPEHLEHIPQAVLGKAPNCTETGWTDGSICSVCGITITEQEIIPATGHTPEIEMDCMAPVSCEICGAELEKELGHDYVQTVVAPDCLEEGYTVYECSRCADTYTEQFVSALGHSFDDWIVTEEPTCTLEGMKCRSCSVCGIQEFEIVSSIGHSYNETTILPTCTQGGYTMFSCHCGVAYAGNYTEAIGHREVISDAYPATCTQAGLTEGRYCENCGEIYLRQEKIPAMGHRWNDGEILAAVTNYSDGVILYSCQECDESKMEEVPALDHIHMYTESVTVPVCENQGYTTYSCVCGACYTDDYVKALGHAEETIAEVSATCSSVGMTEGCYCTVCQAIIVEPVEIPALEHIWDEGILIEEPNEDTEGKKQFTCTVCGSSKEVDVPILGHVHEYDATIVEPACTKQGYTEWVCSCGDYYYSDYIAAVGHTENFGTSVSASCTTNGQTAGSYCAVCGEVLECGEHIFAQGHQWDDGFYLAEPGTYSSGLISYTCLNCEAQKTEKLPPQGHIHKYAALVTAADCEEQGYTTFYCECGEEYIDDFVDAYGHDYDEKHVVSEVNCNVNGEEIWNCKTCGHKENVVIPQTGHLFEQNEGKIVCQNCTVELNLVLQSEYIALHMGKTKQIEVAISPEEFISRITWSTDDENIIQVDETGMVTAVGEGTAYVSASVCYGDLAFTARCRVDVMNSIKPEDIQLSTTKLTTELYSTDYESFEILLQIPQNYPLEINTYSLRNRNSGVTVESANFSSEVVSELFELLVLDDRHVLVIPTEKAMANPGVVKESYSSAITIKLTGVEEILESNEKLNLTVKKTVPKLTAEIDSFNSFVSGQSKEICITGGTVTDISLNEETSNPIPSWLFLEGRYLTLTKEAPLKTISAKVHLLVKTEEWAIPAKVSLSVKNSYKERSVRLSSSSVTITKDDLFSKGVTLELKCENKGDTLEDLNVVNVTAPSGYEIFDFDQKNGNFLLKMEKDVNAGVVYLEVHFGDTDNILRLPLEVKLSTVVLKFTKNNVVLNSGIQDEAIIAVTVNPKGHIVEKPVIRLTDTSKNKVNKIDSGELLIWWDAEKNAIHIKTTELTPEKANYKLYISADGSKEAPLTIKVINKVPSVSFQTKGKLDLGFPNKTVTIIPKFTNYSGGQFELISWSVTEKNKSGVKECDSEMFDLNQEGNNLILSWKERIYPENTYEIKILLGLPDGTEVENRVNIVAQRSDIKLKVGISSVKLNRMTNDAVDIAVSSIIKDYVLKSPLMELRDSKGKMILDSGGELVNNNKLYVTWKNDKIRIELGADAKYGESFQIRLKANEYSSASVIKVSIPVENKSKISLNLKAKGSIDVIRQGSEVVITPTYKNCTDSKPWEEKILVFTSADNYKEPVDGVFLVERNDIGQFILTQAGAVDPNLKYKVCLVSKLGDVRIKSKLTNISVKMGNAPIIMEAEDTILFAKDKYDRAVFKVFSKDDTLNKVQTITVNGKYQKLFEIIDYGNGEFAIGFKDYFVDSSIKGKSVSLNLSVYMEGNETTKANAVVKLRLKVLK